MYYRYLGWTDGGIFLFAIKHFLHFSSYFVVLVLYMLYASFLLCNLQNQLEKRNCIKTLNL